MSALVANRRPPLLAVLIALAVVGCFALPFLPRLPKDELVRTATWGLAALGGFVGVGGVIGRFSWPRERVPVALRGVLGIAVFCAGGGFLALIGLVSRPLLVGYVVLGLALLLRDLWNGRDELSRELHLQLRTVRLHPVLALVGLTVASLVLIQYLGAASDVSSNPYDDDISYYPFAKQLIQRGTLLDPFSFRRMSTLGGQALLHALMLARLGIAHVGVLDRGIGFLLSVGLLVSHRVGPERRRVPALARLLSVFFLAVLPNTSINSSSHYSGLALFLALFQMLERLPEGPATNLQLTVRRLLPFALTGAALCTLRQNFQSTVGLLIVFGYGSQILRLRRSSPLRRLLVEPLVAIALTGLFVVPWLALLYRSNDTFLFPLMPGTFRANVAVTSSSMTLSRLVRFFLQCWFNPDPIGTLPIFALVGLCFPDRNPRRPLGAAWLATIASFFMLCVAFSLSDSGNLARYIFACATAAILLTWQTVATRFMGGRHGERRGILLFAGLTILAFVLPLQNNISASLSMLHTRVRDTAELWRRSVPPQPEAPVAASYRRLQERVPPGEKILVMVDKPYFLDFARNQILNLDMPGTASPKPDIPCFVGVEPVAEYLQAQGIHYVLFVDPDRSAYLYRREVWLDHIFDPEEIWRVYAPYMVNVTDNLIALGRTRAILGDEANMKLLDVRVRAATN